VQWLHWAFFYKIFICEMLLRTKQAKAVLRLPILIALIFLYSKVPEPVWRLLQKLRIVCSRKTLEDWVKNQPPLKISDENVILFSFDNLDFHKHVTNVRSNHKSKMLHICTRFIVNFQQDVEIFASELWKTVNKDNFIEYVCSDFDFANNIAKNAWEGVSNVWESNWLKFATVEGVSNVIYKNLIILPPIIPCNTSTYVDVQKLLEDCFY
jgi:hypothetical protein